MEYDDARDREIASLRDRLSRLSEASLRINESLDLDTVLQDVLDSARSLTRARCGILTLLDESGTGVDFLSSKQYSEESGGIWGLGREARRLFDHFGSLMKPIRIGDLLGYVRSIDLPESDSLLLEGPSYAFLAAPVFNRGERVGSFYLGDKEDGDEFTEEDMQTLVMFASQAALAITNSLRHQQEQRARKDLETLIYTSPVGVVVLDAKTGGPLSYNREVVRIMNVLRIPDRPLEHLMETITIRRSDGWEVSLKDQSLAEVLRNAETVRAEEMTFQVPDGRSVTTLINATPIRAEGGDVETYVVTLQDMTPLEDLERLRAEFLAMVSHELRTPLTSVKGSVANLLDPSVSLDPAEVAQFHRIIDIQTDRMRDLISDLLDVARIQTGSLSVSPGPSNVAALIDEAKNTYLSGDGRNNIRIELPPGLPLVSVDKRRIVQVIGNLLSNASKHSPESSVIRITAQREGLYVRVAVIDQGRGISADRLPYLFQKFSRFDVEDQGGDTGLGLAICKGIVEAHGGRIWAESDELGLGTRFFFTLPADGEAESSGHEETQPSGSRSLSAGKERTRILVVDDDPQTLRYARDVLTKAGYGVVITADPKEVSGLVAEEEPHLVLLDLLLPGIGGMELMKVIRAMTKAPIIFLSAYGQDQVIATAFENGAADYIVKPFSPTELVARIRAALRKQDPPELDFPGDPRAFGDLVIDYARRQVTVAGEPVELTPLEYRLLAELSANADRVMTHEQLLRRVWGQDNSGGSGPVRTYVKRLRQKLRDDPNNPAYIFTKRRVGYWMELGETQGEGQGEKSL